MAKGAEPQSGERWLPGLDGLRAIAVVAVLAFHAGLIRGGFLGVSLFFTLSGFLITYRTLSGPGARPFNGLSFIMARLRRLAPALLVAVALGVWVVVVWGRASQRSGVGASVGWALTYTWNWREILHHTTYADRFTLPTPFDHLWSLAIEEQFYLLYVPLAFVLGRISRRLGYWLVGFLCVITMGVPLMSDYSLSHQYFGLDTRSAELLAGVLLGLIWPRIPHNRISRMGREVAIVVLLAGFALLCWRIGPSSRFVRSGGLGLVPLISVPLLAFGALQSGWLRWEPLRRIGERSYGIYLVHWPIQVALTNLWPRMAPRALFLAVLVLSIPLASISLACIENPIRFKRISFRNAALRIGVITVALVGGLIALPNDDARNRVELSGLANASPIPRDGRPGATKVTWSVVGDSAPLTLAITRDAEGKANWVTYEVGNVDLVSARSEARIGCGLVPQSNWAPECQDRIQAIAKMSSEEPANVAIVMPSFWDRNASGSAVIDAYRDAVTALQAGGTRVVLIPAPTWHEGACAYRRAAEPDEPCDEEAINERLAALNAAAEDGAVSAGAQVLDVSDFVVNHDPATNHPDGVHWTTNGAIEIMQWLAPQLVAVAGK